MERYFPPDRTDLVLFPLEHISCRELLDKMLKDRDEVAAWCGEVYHAFRIQLFLESYERNLRTFSRESMQTGGTEPQEIRNNQVHNFPGTEILTFSWRIGDQEQVRTVADHFASSVVSTRKTRRHLAAFHD